MKKHYPVSFIEWVSVIDRNPPSNETVLLVTNDLVFEAAGRPSVSVDVGYYKPESASYQLISDELVKGEVFFWAPLPDVPWDLLPVDLSRKHVKGRAA